MEEKQTRKEAEAEVRVRKDQVTKKTSTENREGVEAEVGALEDAKKDVLKIGIDNSKDKILEMIVIEVDMIITEEEGTMMMIDKEEERIAMTEDEIGMRKIEVETGRTMIVGGIERMTITGEIDIMITEDRKADEIQVRDKI